MVWHTDNWQTIKINTFFVIFESVQNPTRNIIDGFFPRLTFHCFAEYHRKRPRASDRAMYRYLEKDMKPSLHRDESLSEESTRRRAASFVIDDDSRYSSQASIGSFAKNKLAEPNPGARVERVTPKGSLKKK